MLKKVFEYLAVAILACIWAALLMPWDGFLDPDAFYHAKASALVWASGPIQAFQWLDLTFLDKHYADQHFLFHAAVAPFTAWFGQEQGLRVASCLFAGFFLWAFYVALKLFRLPKVWMWTGLVALTQPLMFRLLLGKASPLAVMLYVVGLALAWRRSWFCLGALTTVFVLTHGGWVYLLASVPLLFIGEATYRHFIQDQPWKKSVDSGMMKCLSALFVGLVLGFALHPNRGNLLELMWAQVVLIGLGTPMNRVALGNEWYPPDVGALFSSLAIWIIPAGIGVIGLFMAPRKPLEHERARLAIALSWILACLVALTLKSRRNVEYLVPVMALWTTTLCSLVEWREMWTGLRESFSRYKPAVAKIAIGFTVFAYVALLGRGILKVWVDMHPAIYPNKPYAATIEEISRRAQPGERVFHASWDEFPMLFAANDRLRYVSGLDPTFLLIASSTLSNAVRDATLEDSTSTSDTIFSLVESLESDFVFASRTKHPKFIQKMVDDARFEKIADFPDSVAFQLK